jgi:hypothetical protein
MEHPQNVQIKGGFETLPRGDISISIIADPLRMGNIHYDPQSRFQCDFKPKPG